MTSVPVSHHSWVKLLDPDRLRSSRPALGGIQALSTERGHCVVQALPATLWALYHHDRVVVVVIAHEIKRGAYSFFLLQERKLLFELIEIRLPRRFLFIVIDIAANLGSNIGPSLPFGLDWRDRLAIRALFATEKLLDATLFRCGWLDLRLLFLRPSNHVVFFTS